MNQQQRNYLVEKIKETHDQLIRSLKDSKEAYPNASTHIYRAILEGTLRIKPEKDLINVLKHRAMVSKEGSDWLSKSTNAFYSGKSGTVAFEIEKFFEFPESFSTELARVTKHNAKIDVEIMEAIAAYNTLEMRIKLASDKVLDKMINEIDDMGNLSLIDTKIKQLGNE